MATQKNETIGQKLRKIQTEEIGKAFNSGDEAQVESLRTLIVGMSKLIGEVRSAFDMCVDKRDEGFFGEDFAPNVQRIRAKSELVGRPRKEKKDELAELDF